MADTPRKGHAYYELDMIVTEYGKNGRCTGLYWCDGTAEVTQLTVETVLKRIAEAYGKTPQSLRRHWRMAHGRTGEKQFGKMAILAVSPGVTLMPVKLAGSMVGRDAPVGYVNLAQPIRFLEEKGGNGARSRILFPENEHAMATAWTCGTLRRHCSAARQFWLEELHRHEEERALVERANLHVNYVNFCAKYTGDR